ncbi:DUF397 domain-containing protein [Streptodolium elevatio]
MVWIKSSHSSNADNACVEVARADGHGVLTRDSKRPDGPRLCFNSRVWADFLGGHGNREGFVPHTEPAFGYTPHI